MDAAELTQTDLYVVSVTDSVAETLAGHPGLSYTSPPQPYHDALTLAAGLLGRHPNPTANDARASRWTTATAGGRRLTLTPTTKETTMATLPGADIRGYYTALGIELPAWAQEQASVRCFADPDAHQHEDRNPSCSVNLTTGAFNCHGCGAHGGAYDAARARGHTPRSAIDLMIAHDLTDRRTQTTARQPALSTIRSLRTAQAAVPAPLVRAARARFTVAERDIQRWQQALARRPGLLEALTRDRGWSYETIRELELGLDQLCQRITIPIRDPDGQLQGLLRYDPAPNRRGPKMRAAPGTRLGLIPHPDRGHSPELLLCEGPSDMLAAQSARLPAIAVPSATAWRTEWTEYFQGHSVTIAMDADPAGRHAARTITHDLTNLGIHSHTIDVAPHRNDGYDLSDWLADHPRPVTAALLRKLTSPLDPFPQLHQVAQPIAQSWSSRRPVARGRHTLAPDRRIP